jgi:hypothetical protein
MSCGSRVTGTPSAEGHPCMRLRAHDGHAAEAVGVMGVALALEDQGCGERHPCGHDGFMACGCGRGFRGCGRTSPYGGFRAPRGIRTRTVTRTATRPGERQGEGVPGKKNSRRVRDEVLWLRVEMEHREHPNESNRALARRVGCDDKTIAKVRRELGLSRSA